MSTVFFFKTLKDSSSPFLAVILLIDSAYRHNNGIYFILYFTSVFITGSHQWCDTTGEWDLTKVVIILLHIFCKSGKYLDLPGLCFCDVLKHYCLFVTSVKNKNKHVT